ALFRLADGFFAIGDRCSHAEASLAESDVDPEAGEVACHRHGARFDIRTGKNLSLPATRPVPRFPVRVVDGQVEVAIESGGAPAPARVGRQLAATQWARRLRGLDSR